MQYVYWFRELANLRESWASDLKFGELYVSGFPVPAGFVVAPVAKEFISQAVEVVDVSQVSPSSIPEALRKKIVDCYFSLDSGIDYDALTADARALVHAGRRAGLVRVKSRTREFENVRGSGEVLQAVLRCLSDGGPVVVQKMVHVEKSGTASVRSDSVVIKSIYGELKALVGRETEPDVFHVSTYDDRVQSKTLGRKELALVVGEDRRFRRVRVSAEKQESFSLHQKELEIVSRLAKKVGQSYPGKAALWGVSGRRVYLLGMVDASSEIVAETRPAGASEAELLASPNRKFGGFGAVSSSMDGFSLPAPPPTRSWSESSQPSSFDTPQRPLYTSPAESQTFSGNSPTVSPPNKPRDYDSQGESKEEAGGTGEGLFGGFFDSDFGAGDREPERKVREFGFGGEGSVFAPEPKVQPLPSQSSPPAASLSGGSVWGGAAKTEEKMDDVFGKSGDFFSGFDEPEPENKKDEFSFEEKSVSHKPQAVSSDFSSYQKPSVFGTSQNAPRFDTRSEPMGSDAVFSPFTDLQRPLSQSHSPNPSFESPAPLAPRVSEWEEKGGRGMETEPNESSRLSSAELKVGLFVDGASYAEQAARQNPDMVFLNMEKFARANRDGAQIDFGELARTIFNVLKVFSDKDVSIVLSGMGGEQANLLGARGARRLDSRALEMELTAIGRAANEVWHSGSSPASLHILLPFVTNVSEIRHAGDLLTKYRLDEIAKLGVVVETPAAVGIIEEVCEQVDSVVVNVDNLAQHILAIDMSDERVRHLFNVRHSAVLGALRGVAKVCRRHGVSVYAVGDAALGDDELVSFLNKQEFDGAVASSAGFSRVRSMGAGQKKEDDFGSFEDLW